MKRLNYIALALAGLLLTGFGIGLANPAIANIALGVVPPQRSGMASGISNTFRIAGLAVGVAGLGAAFQSRLGSSLHSSLGGAQGTLAKAVHAQTVALKSFVTALNEIFLVGAGLVLLGGLAGVALVRARDFHGRAAAAPAIRTEAETA